MTATDPNTVLTTASGAKITVAELHARVSMPEPGVIVLREIDMGTPATLAAMGARIEELAAGLEAFGLVVDLSDSTGGTSTEYRRFLPEYFQGLSKRADGRMKHIAVAFLGNPLARVVTRFVIGRILGVPASIHKNAPLAIAAVRGSIPPKRDSYGTGV